MTARCIFVVLVTGLLVTGCPSMTFTADPVANGAHTFSLDSMSFGRDIALTLDGGLLIVGDAGPDLDMGVAKLAPDKTVLWSRSLPGVCAPYTENRQLAAVDGEGGGLAVGSRKWLNTIDGEPQRIMLHRFAADGNTVWEGTLGPDDSHPTACIRHGDGFAIAGRGFSFLPGQDGGMDPHGYSAFVVGIAEDGEERWRRQLDVDELEVYLYAMAETGDGSIVAVGRHGPSRDASPYSGASEIVVYRLSAAGELTWSRTVGADGADDFTPCSVAVGPGGDIWIAGTRWSTASQGGLLMESAFVARLDAEGEVIWWAEDLTERHGWQDVSQARELVVHGDGRAVLVGIHHWSLRLDLPGLSFPWFASTGTPFAVQLGPDGRRTWVCEFGAGESVDGVAVSSEGTYVTCGTAMTDLPVLLPVYELDQYGNLIKPEAGR